MSSLGRSASAAIECRLYLIEVSGQASASLYTFKPSPYSSHSALLAWLPEPGRGRRVLDLGCAGGRMAAFLASRGYDVTGVERPGHAGSDFPREVCLVEADLEAGLPPLEGRFDFVLCADVLEHLRNPESLLRQIHGVLAPDGTLLASLPNSGNLYFRLTVLSGRFPQHDKGLFDRTHLRFYTWDGWRNLLETSGFQIGAVQSTGIPVGLAFPTRQNSLAVRAAERVSYELARAWKRLFAYQFVVQASLRVR